ncbi:MAG: energy transducer TonB [Candidatus Aphodosoma sp.]
MRIQKSEIQSAIVTTIVCIIILLILFFCGMTAHKNEMDEGVMVSLGYADDGYGEQSQPATPTPPATPAISKPAPVMSDEKLMTQDDPSVAMEEERKRRQREEEQRIETERKAREAQEARLRAEREEKQKKAGALAGSAFQNKGKGQGTTQGSSQQGSPIGFGSQGGNSWSLSGRNLVGKLAQPSYKGNQEGVIVVQIRVDASGNVTTASIATGTTITDEAMRKASLEAARKNRFSSDTGVAIGTITYKFSLN